ncbi:hypothetical protein C5Y96_11610 [Blastopirellula marina]|uniref:Disease resistance R13L4/SHOC-2-like LRR domain-containing protein n=1 Tax=Blastopirellula marina TaxID=124 RepID=A0A2S8FMQ1_9BACT|nr:MULTISPECIES: hypothetical protein [Pirellulaceae]PQO33478.1 hypothetical protein C5Y96_11610 [Blastopirellula marina]RCS52569.1 hypothetical protein DTL36_11620 [Bremerella cremea]
MPRFLRQFGLRSLLIFCTLAAGCFGLWRWHMTWVDEQHEVAAQIAEARGDVRWGTWGPGWVHQLFGSYYFSNIVAVDWHHKRIKDEHLQLLRQTPTLEELYIPGTRVTDEGMAVLEDLPKIRKLALWSTRLTNETLKRVGKLKQLEVLDIHRTKMNEEGLVHLRNHPRLQILRYDLALTDVGISHLASIPNVSVEVLFAKELSFESFPLLRDKLRFNRLYLFRPSYHQWASYLLGHPTLVELEVREALMTDAELQALIATNSLESIELNDVPVGNSAIANAPFATRLKSLQLYGTNVTPEGLLLTYGQYPRNIVVLKNWIRLSNAANGQRVDWMGTLTAQELENLKYCRNATSLHFETDQLAGINFQWLSRLEKLTSLRVDYFGNDQLLQSIASLEGLERLDLAGTKQVTAEGLKSIVSLDQLKVLSLRSADVSDDMLEVIGQMKPLVQLNIAGSAVTDQGIRHLAGLQNLVVLHISNCKSLTDESLKSVGELKKLQYLYAQGTQFTDEGLQYLHEMPRLTNVSLYGSKHTRHGIQLLRDALPLKGINIY